MSAKCENKNVIFLDDGKDSNEQHCKLFLNKDLSSKDNECMDPYANLVDDLLKMSLVWEVTRKMRTAILLI